MKKYVVTLDVRIKDEYPAWIIVALDNELIKGESINNVNCTFLPRDGELNCFMMTFVTKCIYHPAMWVDDAINYHLQEGEEVTSESRPIEYMP